MSPRLLRAALLVAAALALVPAGADVTSVAHAQELTEARRVRIARRLAVSTVSVLCGPGSGSGFVVGDERWVITNHHVVEMARLGVRVRFGSGTTLPARVIRLDPSHDLAILEITQAPVPVPPLDLADSDSVEVGQTVLAFGSPFGLEGTLTEGIVSARRDVPNVGGGMARRLIQTDAPINPGNSGGPLVDRRGRVVGVNTAILSRTGGSHGIGFAVPANYVRELLESTRRERRGLAPTTPTQPAQTQVATATTAAAGPAFLGVTGSDFASGGFRGVQIQSTQPGSPAQRAGLLGVQDPAPELVVRTGTAWTGHVITAVNGQPIASGAELAARIAERQPGETVELTVTVGPGRFTATRRVTLATAPAN